MELLVPYTYQTGGLRPRTKKIIARMRPTTNSPQAISEETAATPPNPNAPAMIATTRNNKAQLSMSVSFVVV